MLYVSVNSDISLTYDPVRYILYNVLRYEAIALNNNFHQKAGYFPEQKYPESPVSSKNDPGFKARLLKTELSRINPLRLAILILCVLVFCTCLFLLARYSFSIIQSRMASRELEKVRTDALLQAPPANESAAPSPVLSATETPVSKPTPVKGIVYGHTPLSTDPWPSVYSNNPLLRASPVFYQLQEKKELAVTRTNA